MAVRLPTGRNRLWTIGGAAVFLVVLAGVLLGRSATGGYQGKYALPPAGAVQPSGPAGPVPPPVGTPATRVAPPPAVSRIDDDDADEPVEDEDADRIAGAIGRATRKALRRGEPVEWHKAGEEGFVAVSEPRDDGERICRNVSATITTDGGRTQSSSHLWCSDDGDEREPAR